MEVYMKNNKKIAVVIPCYKVSRQIKKVTLSIPEFVDFIIVVDDACPEYSGKIVAELLSDRIYIIYHQENIGVGGAVINGYKKALDLESDIIVKLDGDGQMNPNDIGLLTEPLIEGLVDYTKGNRFHDFDALKNMPKIRLFGNSFLSFVIKIASGYWNIMDPTNGFCAITSKALQSINLNRISKRYFFEIDMLVNLNINRYIVQDIPISAKYGDEISNLSLGNSIITFPSKIFNRLIRRLFFKYYIYDFNMGSIYIMLSIPLLFFGFFFGIYRWVTGHFEDVENSAGTIMLVALPVIIGMQFLLQAISIDINNIPKKNE